MGSDKRGAAARDAHREGLSGARLALALAVGALAAVGGRYLQALEEAEHAGGPLLHDLQHQALLGAMVAILTGLLLGISAGGRAIAVMGVATAVGFAVGFLMLQASGSVLG